MSSLSFRVLPRTESPAVSAKNPRNDVRTVTIALFVVPGLLVFLVFFLLPVIQSAQYSFYHWDGFGPLQEFVGLANFEQLLNHRIFHTTIANTLFVTGASVVIQLPLALLMALVLGRGDLRGRRLFRAILFVPYIFSEVVTALVWSYVFQTNGGFINTAIASIAPAFEPVAWLSQQETVLPALFAVVTWKYFGFYMILYMAALHDVPRETEEAARIDGATEEQVLWFVTLPQLASTIRLTIFLAILGSFQQFAIFWTLTKGGPVNASEVFGTYLYKYGIQRFALGYGSAVAIVLFLIMLVFSIGYQRILMRRESSLEQV